MNLESPSALNESDFFTAMAPLLEHIGTADFYKAVIRFLCRMVKCDSPVVLLYHEKYAPQVLFDQLAKDDHKAFYGHYFQGAYLLSPFYLQWRQERQSHGLYRLSDIAPEGFFNSVYYTDYYGKSGLHDEMGYILSLGQDRAVLLALGRTVRLPIYSNHERSRLKALLPLIIQGLRRHTAMADIPQGSALQHQLAEGLDLFGSSVLTDREHSVVQMMLRGHSSKSCARLLSISPTTERVHRRNIYCKLGISSQAELFSLFFQAMSVEDPVPGRDPLQQL